MALKNGSRAVKGPACFSPALALAEEILQGIAHLGVELRTEGFLSMIIRSLSPGRMVLQERSKETRVGSLVKEQIVSGQPAFKNDLLI